MGPQSQVGTSLISRPTALSRTVRALVDDCFRNWRRAIISWLFNNKYIRTFARSRLSHDSPRVFRIGRRTVLKIGTIIRMTEATTMRYLAEHTSIPVPSVIDAWHLDGGGAAILMEWIDCAGTFESLQTSLTPQSKAQIAEQVRGYIEELRTLEQPPEMKGYIGPIDGAELWDGRVKQAPCAPFPSETAFNKFRLAELDILRFDPSTNERITQLENRLRGDHRIVFTHGDLNSRNILLDKQHNVVGLLDWEMSGWMPEYWEYVKAIDGK